MTLAVPASIRSKNRPVARVPNTVAFLRMAAVQMRRLAECVPEIAAELRDLAGDLDEEANEFTADETQ